MSCCGVIIMPYENPSPSAPRRPFELTGGMVAAMLILFFGVVVSVNATILTMALRTMPGRSKKGQRTKSFHSTMRYPLSLRQKNHSMAVRAE